MRASSPMSIALARGAGSYGASVRTGAEAPCPIGSIVWRFAYSRPRAVRRASFRASLAEPEMASDSPASSAGRRSMITSSS